MEPSLHTTLHVDAVHILIGALPDCQGISTIWGKGGRLAELGEVAELGLGQGSTFKSGNGRGARTSSLGERDLKYKDDVSKTFLTSYFGVLIVSNIRENASSREEPGYLSAGNRSRK